MAMSKDPIQPPPLLPRSDLLSLPSPPSPDIDLLDYFSRKYSNEYLVVTLHDLLWVVLGSHISAHWLLPAFLNKRVTSVCEECHGSGWSPGSIPDQTMCYLWWQTGTWTGFAPSISLVAMSVLVYQIFIFIHPLPTLYNLSQWQHR
jgi:hypothetical protein